MSRRPRRSSRIAGRDFAPMRLLSPSRRWLPAALIGGLLAALTVAALRVDLIRIRYGLADALEREKALSEDRQVRIARVRALRDPARLAERARQLGFLRPERAIDLRNRLAMRSGAR